jgi:hypothetical protein
LRDRVVEVVAQRVQERLWGVPSTDAWLQSQMAALESGSTNPFAVADELLARSGDLLTRVME